MSFRREMAAGVGLGILVALSYLSALPGDFHFDDYHSLVDNPGLRAASIKSIFTNPRLFSGLPAPMYRPVTVFSFAVQARLGPLDPLTLVAVNVFLHAVCAGLCFGVARMLFQSSAPALPQALPRRT